MSGQAGRYQRSAGGMVGALLVLVAVIAAFIGFRALNRDDPPSPVREVDYVKVADFARDQAPFALASPATLPDGWRATTVDYQDGERARWHVGMLTGTDQYVGLEQSGSSAESMVETYVDEAAVPGDPIAIDGEDWATWSDAGGDLALVRESGDTTTLVVGHGVSEQVLSDFVASLG